MAASWRLLSVSSNTSELPPLLISAVFSQNSYTIHITDLTRLWSESLDRKAIVQRSLNEGTVIDGSEDAEQLRLLLQKIQGGIAGNEDSIITLKHDRTSSKDEPALHLHIRLNLPEPLRPLEWPVQLSLGDSSSFTEMVTVPLLAAQNARVKELESLVEVLKDKDHVVQKLVDKLETSGADWGQVFPNAAVKGGKKTTRAQVSSKVKGLTAFDRAQWSRDMKKDHVSADLKDLAAQAFGTDRGLEISNDNIGSTPEKWKSWWEKFEGTSTKVAPTLPSAFASDKYREKEREDDVGDFQVQSTPLGYSQSSNKKKSPEPLDDSTTEDEDFGAASQISIVPDSFPIHDMVSSSAPQKEASKGKKLAVIGRSKTTEVNRSSKPQVFSNDVADDSMNDSPSSPLSPPKPKAQTQAKPKKGGLGKIGGRKRALTPLPQSPIQAVTDSDKEQETVDTPASSQKNTRKLGLMGRKAQASSVVKEEVRGRSPEVEEKKASPPRETSEERALRRRKEIQKELEEKAASKKPVKKRRKF